MRVEFAILLPLVIWLALRFSMPAGPYEMDHGNGSNPGTFFPLAILYHVFFYFLAILSFVGAWINWNEDSNGAAFLLLIAAICALLFNGVTVFFYESYVHSRYKGIMQAMGTNIPQLGPSNYTLSKYALVLALGFSCVMLFVAGAIWTAMVVR